MCNVYTVDTRNRNQVFNPLFTLPFPRTQQQRQNANKNPAADCCVIVFHFLFCFLFHPTLTQIIIIMLRRIYCPPAATRKECKTFQTFHATYTALTISSLNRKCSAWALKFVKLYRRDEAKIRRLLCHQDISTIATGVKAFTRFNEVLKMVMLSWHHSARNRTETTVKPYNASTWPKHLGPEDIKTLLRNKIATDVAPNYNVLAMLLEVDDIHSLNILLRAFVRAPQGMNVDMITYLQQHVNHKATSKKIPLMRARASTFKALNHALSPFTGSEKRNVVVSASAGGQLFLKQFLSQHRADAMKCGRVIVRCCNVAASEGWMNLVKKDGASVQLKSHTNPSSHMNSMDKGLCELIRSHVESVTGMPQQPFNYCDTHTAYKSWMKETAWFFRISDDATNVAPLIILDNCEVLSQTHHKSFVHGPTRTPYTLLEAFCLAIPSPYSILAMGCKAKFDVANNTFSLSIANVTNIANREASTALSL